MRSGCCVPATDDEVDFDINDFTKRVPRPHLEPEIDPAPPAPSPPPGSAPAPPAAPHLEAEETSKAPARVSADGTGLGKNLPRCKNCAGCEQRSDCGECRFCLDKLSFGGTGTLRRACERRRCVAPRAEKKGDAALPVARRGKTRVSSFPLPAKTKRSPDESLLRLADDKPASTRQAPTDDWFGRDEMVRHRSIQPDRADVSRHRTQRLHKEPPRFSPSSNADSVEAVEVAPKAALSAAPKATPAAAPKATPKATHKAAEPKAAQPKAEPKATPKAAEPKAAEPKTEPKAAEPKPEPMQRCGDCAGCYGERTCGGTCRFCLDKVAFGGPGKLRRPCAMRTVCLGLPQVEENLAAASTRLRKEPSRFFPSRERQQRQLASAAESSAAPAATSAAKPATSPAFDPTTAPSPDPFTAPVAAPASEPAEDDSPVPHGDSVVAVEVVPMASRSAALKATPAAAPKATPKAAPAAAPKAIYARGYARGYV